MAPPGPQSPPSAWDRRRVVPPEQDPEVGLPRTDDGVLRAGHPREDLRYVVKIVDGRAANKEAIGLLMATGGHSEAVDSTGVDA